MAPLWASALINHQSFSLIVSRELLKNFFHSHDFARNFKLELRQRDDPHGGTPEIC